MSEWKETTLGQVAEFKNGKKAPKRKFNGNISIYGANGIIGYSDLYNSVDETIVIGRVGSYCGSTYYTNMSCWVTDNAIVGKSKYNSDAKFIFYYLTQIGLNRHKSGSGQPLINQSTLEQISIFIPENKSEQKSIAAILTSLDDKIDNLRRQNKTLEQMAGELFKEWFVNFNFPFDFVQGKPCENGKPYKKSGGKMIASELGEIPEGWRVGTLEEEFEIIMGQSPTGSSYNNTGEGEVFFQGRTDFGFRFPVTRLYTSEPKRMAFKFDVLVSVRAPVGDINVASEKCCIGRGLSAVKSEYKSYCLYKLMSFKKVFSIFENEGTVFGSLNKESFNNLENILPMKSVIEQYNNIVIPLDLKIYNNTKQIQTLTTLRDTLLPKLMSGQIRVKD